MMTQPSAPSPVRFSWVIAAMAASMFGAVYLPTTSPTVNFVAECLDGQVVDPSTGTCPTAAAPAVTPKDMLENNSAVEAANEFGIDGQGGGGYDGGPGGIGSPGTGPDGIPGNNDSGPYSEANNSGDFTAP